MKYIFFIIAFLIWSVITLISVILVVPLILLIETEWFDYPLRIFEKC